MTKEELRLLRIAQAEVAADPTNYYDRHGADWAEDIGKLLDHIDALEANYDDALAKRQASAELGERYRVAFREIAERLKAARIMLQVHDEYHAVEAIHEA